MHDQIRIANENSSIKEFPFLLVSDWNQTRFEEVDGVIGLSKTFITTNGTSSGPKLLDGLLQAGEIDLKMFSVHFDNIGGSTLELGGYDLNNAAPGVPIVNFEVPYERKWRLTMNGFRVGDKTKFKNGARSSFKVPEAAAYLDTFSPHISIPRSYGGEIFSYFFHGLDYDSIMDDVLVGTCDLSYYFDLYFFINDKYYLKIQPSSYIIDIGYSDKCFIAIKFSDDDTWTLGEPFFRNYYAIFDDS